MISVKHVPGFMMILPGCRESLTISSVLAAAFEKKSKICVVQKNVHKKIFIHFSILLFQFDS